MYMYVPVPSVLHFQVTKQSTKAASHKHVEYVTLVSRTFVINSWLIEIFGLRNLSLFVEVRRIFISWLALLSRRILCFVNTLMKLLQKNVHVGLLSYKYQR